MASVWHFEMQCKGEVLLEVSSILNLEINNVNQVDSNGPKAVTYVNQNSRPSNGNAGLKING